MVCSQGSCSDRNGSQVQDVPPSSKVSHLLCGILLQSSYRQHLPHLDVYYYLYMCVLATSVTSLEENIPPFNFFIMKVIGYNYVYV